MLFCSMLEINDVVLYCVIVIKCVRIDRCFQVCPDTSEVIALVYVLIRARPPKDKHVHGLRGMRYVPHHKHLTE